MAPFGPLATMLSKAGASAPRSIMARSRATANDRSVTPGRSQSSVAVNASPVIAHALASNSISDSSLIMRSSSGAPPSGTSAGEPSSAASA